MTVPMETLSLYYPVSSWPYTAFAFISVAIFACVHLFAEKTQKLGTISHGRFLSAGGGVAIAYVFMTFSRSSAKMM